MDQAGLSAELEELRKELERLRFDVAEAASLRRQLQGAHDQLRRARESIERRDAILREAKQRLAALSSDIENARRERDAAKEALAKAMGARWFALRRAVRWAGRRPWRWLAIPWKVLTHRGPPSPEKTAQPADRWEPHVVGPSRPTVPRAPRSLRVAAIAGSDLVAALGPECTLLTFGPDGWLAALEDGRPHLVLVESDVYANDGAWQGQLDKGSDADELRALIAWCRRREIPAVFWNTKDPLELERWLPVASLFEHLLTVDGDAVPRYVARGALGMTNVGVLAEGVQPRIFDPASAGRTARACFVVTEAHTADARMWAETAAVLASAGDSIDVYSMPGVTTADPIAGSVRELGEPLSALLRRYAVVLSAPGKGDTAQRIPRRVLEMMASGAAVVAPASPDVSLNIASGVRTFRGAVEARDAIGGLLDEEQARERLVTEAQTWVLGSHTAMHRLAAIAAAAGFNVDDEAERRTSALLLVDHPDDASRPLQSLASQSRPPDEIIVGTKTRAGELEEKSGGMAGIRVRIVKQNGDARPQRLRELARIASTPWVFLPGVPEDVQSLEQLVLRAPFVDADVIARAAAGETSYSAGADVAVVPVVVRRLLVAERGWPDDVETLRRWSREGVRFYAIPPAR